MDKVQTYMTCPKDPFHDIGISSMGKDKYCWQCGTKLQEYSVQCSAAECGRPGTSVSKFCTRCGKPTKRVWLDPEVARSKEGVQNGQV